MSKVELYKYIKTCPLKINQWIYVLWVALAGIFIYFSALTVSTHVQLLIVLGVFVMMWLVRRHANHPVWRIVFLLLAMFITMRYMVWRVTSTISYFDPVSLIAALALLLAEIYGVTVYFLGIFVNIFPLHRASVPLPPDQSLWPTVDVVVPSYNEPESMLKITLLAALQMRYPKHLLRVCLLDDGGTVQKRNDTNVAKAHEAQQRHDLLSALCERIGVSYMTRKQNLHAKAGNINAALEHLSGRLVLVLDADHVPTVDLLENTVGLFVADEKMFLVQTPHFFINPDPIERNLKLFSQMPSEHEMFYRVIQHGLDFWNSAFFCGSAAVLRRTCLDEIGGISGQSVTEDAETALTLHAKGYHSAYIGRPMISGLQTETYTGFVVQRVRWAQGMVQILLLKNPLLQKGLAPWQRLGYFSSAFFWFFAYARVVFVLAPAAYLVFGLRIFDANMQQFLAYALPHIVAAIWVQDVLFGSVRWAFISELYELMQAFYSLPGIARVIKNPRSPSFMVTPKGEKMDDDFLSKLSGPFYATLLLTFISLIFGLYRYFHFPLYRDVIKITMGWEVFNFTILLAALGALYERRQRRAVPRMPTNMLASVCLDGQAWLPCTIKDMSVGGVLLRVKRMQNMDKYCPLRMVLRVDNVAMQHISELELEIKRMALSTGQRDWLLSGKFVLSTDAVASDVVGLVLGDSARWEGFLQGRSSNGKSIFRAYVFLLRIGLRNGGQHIFEILHYGIVYLFKFLIIMPISQLYLFFIHQLISIRNWALYNDSLDK